MIFPYNKPIYPRHVLSRNHNKIQWIFQDIFMFLNFLVYSFSYCFCFPTFSSKSINQDYLLPLSLFERCSLKIRNNISWMILPFLEYFLPHLFSCVLLILSVGCKGEAFCRLWLSVLFNFLSESVTESKNIIYERWKMWINCTDSSVNT